MKKIILIPVFSAWAMLAEAQISTNSYTLTPEVGIPDGNPAGVTETFSVSGLTAATGNIQVSLDITGGFNGDLYAYLVAPDGNMAVLLNRVGVSGSNPIGYSDSGFDITFDDSGVNIHNYQSGSYSLTDGQLTGTWAPDGRAIDPQSAGTVFDSASTAADLGNLFSSNPNGTWTLFVADLSSGGGTATLNSSILMIVSTPEPQTWALFGFGMGALALICLNRFARLG